MKTLFPFLAALSAAMLLAGCLGPVVPQPIVDTGPSFDGTNLNSGFYFYMPDGSGIITAHARDRYNSLIRIYGKSWTIPLTYDDGIKPGPILNGAPSFQIDAEHLTKFGIMNDWRKENHPPANQKKHWWSKL